MTKLIRRNSDHVRGRIKIIDVGRSAVRLIRSFRPLILLYGWLLAAAITCSLSACASKTVEQINNVSFTPGKEDVAVIGTPFIWRETGTVESNEHWEGVLFGGMHDSSERGADYQRIELFYGGRSGEIVTFLYQVTVGNDATPNARQTYRIDLTKGDRFAIEGLQIRCIQADSNSMRYVVLSDDSRWSNSAAM
jgi:hypothetical protein